MIEDHLQVFMLAGGAISWESKKQTTVSSTEAEYMASSSAAKEAVYLSNLMAEIGYFNKNKYIVLKTDN